LDTTLTIQSNVELEEIAASISGPDDSVPVVETTRFTGDEMLGYIAAISSGSLQVTFHERRLWVIETARHEEHK
jgi:hypothetical protein